MATSHGLSIPSPPFSCPSSSSSSSSSTHDTNIFIPSLSTSTTSLLKSSSDNCKFSSLEELLSATGIPPHPSAADTIGTYKRPHDTNDDGGEIEPAKRPRLGSPITTLPSSTNSSLTATGMGLSPVPAHELIPSILGHTPSLSNHTSSTPAMTAGSATSNQNHLPSILSSVPSTSLSSGLANNLSTPSVSLSSMLTTSVASSFPVLANPNITTSVTLLAQLYKQYQAIGDLPGMQKTKQQLVSVIAKATTKPVALNLTPATITTTAAISTEQQVQQPAPSFSPSLPVVTPTPHNAGTLPVLTSAGSTPAPVPSCQSMTNTTTATPSLASGLGHTAPVHQLNSITATTSASVSGLTAAPMQLTNTAVTTSLASGVSNNQLSLLSSSSSYLPLSLPQTSKPHSPSIVTQPPPPSTSSSSVPVSSTTPSIIPLSAVAMATQQGAGKSFPSLHITPQTQANIMRAVYSYRLKQIQDFMSSLPPQQRPTTTQGLRDLLVKHNMAAKLQTIPQSLLVQLQQAQAQSSSTKVSSSTTSINTGPSVTTSTTSHTVSSTVLQTTPAPAQPATQPVGATQTMTTVPSLLTSQPTSSQTSQPTLTSSSSSSSSSSASSSQLLPGVTVETLRTLCRLPDSSLSRIPMHRTLLGIVQYLRGRGWAGNRSDLPGLLQQAQEAVNKGQLASQQPMPASNSQLPVKQELSGKAHTLSVSSVMSSHLTSQPPAYTSTSSSLSTSSSPLAQYMASVGMKVPRSTDHTLSVGTTPPGIRVHNNVYMQRSSLGTGTGTINRTGSSSHAQSQIGVGGRPFTRYQLKVQQERVEHERLQALQKVLQSSEEARIAFRFQAHMEKLHQQLCSPDTHRAFSSYQDVVLRLVPYHVWAEPELPAGAVEKADAVYEGIASVLLSRANGLMSRYDQSILQDEERGGETDPTSILLEKLFLEGERERKEEERREEEDRKRRAQGGITTELGGVTDHGPFVDTGDPFLMDSDPFSDDPFLSHFWSTDLTVDLGTGIT